MKIFAFVFFSAGMLTAWQSSAAPSAYWLGRGGKVVAKCPGVQDQELKAANKSLGEWLLLTARVKCSDTAGEYHYLVEFVSVSLNARLRESITWDEIPFYWIGFTAFRSRDDGRKIEWLYDDAKQVNGSLSKSSTAPIYFGNLTFSVPKVAVDRAEQMLFYINAGGIYFTFEFL